VNYSYSDDEPDKPNEPYTIARPHFYIRLSRPWWARTLMGINLAVFVAMIVFGITQYNDFDGSTNDAVLTIFGMKVNPLIAGGQSWRLFTAMFLHIGVLHLLSNLYALHALGPMVEGYYGHLRFLAIYLIAGLSGSVASYAFSAADSAGASGAIFGLIGATTVYFLRYRENFGAQGRAIIQNMLLVIAINLIFGLSVPFIDNWGHMGGLVGGAIAAWGLLPRYRPPTVTSGLGTHAVEEEPRARQEALLVLVCLAVLWLATQWVTATRL